MCAYLVSLLKEWYMYLIYLLINVYIIMNVYIFMSPKCMLSLGRGRTCLLCAVLDIDA